MNASTVRYKLCASLLLLLILPFAAPVLAVDYFVTRYDDPVPGTCLVTDCSLREAVLAASAASNADRIFLSAGTYALSRPGGGEDSGLTGDLDVHGSVEILGAGATMTTIDANGIDRVLHLHAIGGSAAARLEDVAITGGLANAETAAVLVFPGADLTIERCEIYGNSNTTTSLGAVRIGTGSVLILRDSTVHDNVGGGVAILQGEGQIFNTTFSNNDGAELQITNQATAYCSHCTVRDTAPDAVAEVRIFDSNLELANTAILGTCELVNGATIASFGGNLESPGATCTLIHATDQDGVVNHGLGPLAENGGPTPTFLPTILSPALGGANDALCPPTDQRGATRPNTNCDIGAVERVAVRPLTPIFADGLQQGSGGAWSLFVP